MNIKLKRTPQWVLLLFFLLSSRAVLNAVAFYGADRFPQGVGIASLGLCSEPRSLVCLWASWDGDYYLKIASHGYSYHGAELAFFPAYPILVHLLALGIPSLMPWSGLLISNTAFVAACMILWHQLKLDFSESVAWGTVISYNVFPTSLFFSAIYSESLFLLFSVLVYWFSARKQYLIGGALVSAASLTRASGILLALIPLTEIFLSSPSARLWMRALAIGLASSIGLALYAGYLWISQGTPIAFLLPQSESWKRSVDLPWRTLVDGIAVVLAGSGSGRSDLLATIPFIVLAFAAFFFVRRSLFLYALATMAALLIIHGPVSDPLYSMARFVLGLFPCFIVLAVLLERIPKLKWAIWAISAIRLIYSTAFFASGGWVA